jgi:hypothetical protein
MRATRLSKLLLKALRTDSNSVASVPLNFEKLVGQTGNFIEFRDTDQTTVLGAIDANGMVQTPNARLAIVTISAADLVSTAAGKFGHAAGYPLVADPGANKAVELVSAVMSYTYATAAYTAGGNITLNSNGGSALTGLVSAANSVGAAASNVTQFVPLATAGITLTANKGLNLVSSAAFTQPGTAAGTIRVLVSYRVHNLA